MEIESLIESQVPSGSNRDALINSLNKVFEGNATNGSQNSLPGYGLVLSDRAQTYGWDFDAGFPSYGKKNATYFGTDLGIQYLIIEKLTGQANYSFISKNKWLPEELGETNPNFDYFLNIPKHRLNLGVNYVPSTGLYGSFFMNYQSAFESKQGDGRVFTGQNDARAVFDAKLGFRKLLNRSDTTFDLALSVQNLFDLRYSHFPNLPQNQRWVKLSLLVHLD